MQINNLKDILWKQLGASIDMLTAAIKLCPEDKWDTEQKFWYNAFHGLFWTDHYLTLDGKNFTPPAPFTLSEFGTEMPERTYTKEELISYATHCRQKCKALLTDLSEEIINDEWTNGRKKFTVAELLIYNLRHVQHHAAQLNLLLRQNIDDAAKWISEAKDEL